MGAEVRHLDRSQHNGGMKSTAPIARTHDSASDFAVGPATSWAESLGGGAGEDPGRLGRQTCWAVWQEDLAVFEVQQPRGDYLRSMGTTWRGRTLLHAEEGLWLVERGMLAVRPFRAEPREAHALLGRVTNDDGQPNASGSRSYISMETSAQDGWGKKEDAKHGERRGLPGLEGALGTGCSPRRDVLAPTSARAGCTAEPSMSEVPPIRNSEGAPTGGVRLKPQAKGLGESAHGTQKMGRSRTATAVPEATQPRAGHKRGRSGSKEGGQGQDGAPTLPVPVRVLHEVVLSQAGVPWECYRAYAELKQRSYVVRRQPEDAVGHEDDTPRAAPLSWHGCPPSKTHRCNNRDPNDRSSGANNVRTSTNVNADSSSSHENRVEASLSSSSRSSSLPSRAPLSVTFTLYNNRSGSRSFRKSDPGPPDALVVVCRFGDPMPRHGSLVALAKQHAATNARTGTSARRWCRRDDPAAGAGPSPTSAEVSSGLGLARSGAAESRDELDGVPRTRERESDSKGGATIVREQQQQQRRGEGKRATGGKDKGMGKSHAEVSSARNGGFASEAGCEEAQPMARGIKLAVVAGEAGVQLFDVGLHDAGEVAEIAGY
ncbi:unnamed protein product [Scytosiphon promiscuus]